VLRSKYEHDPISNLAAERSVGIQMSENAAFYDWRENWAGHSAIARPEEILVGRLSVSAAEDHIHQFVRKVVAANSLNVST
jgi:hypothetical protein